MTDVSELECRVRHHVEQQAPALASRKAVIAVSGGGDSIATAALLFEAQVLDAHSSVIAHFDHRLRDAAASARDLAAVTALCSRYGVRLETAAWDAPRPDEAAARNARYGFLADVANRQGTRAVVTGHTSDDQVETVLLHAFRGAGLHGLRGMAAEAPLPGAPSSRLVRPVLALARAELRAYADARGLAYAEDATNESRRYARNRVRLDVLPGIESFAPDARAAILRLAADARDEVAAIESIAGSALARAVAGVTQPHVALSRSALCGLPEAVRPYAYRLAIESLLGDARELDRRHYMTASHAHVARTGATIELPRGVMLTVDPHVVIVSIGALAVRRVPAGFSATLPWSGGAGAWRLDIAQSAAADAITLPRSAIVRARRPGDVIALPGGHKKLQDAYVDAKIPRRDRDAAPVIAAGNDVVWTPFLRAQSSAGVAHCVTAARI